MGMRRLLVGLCLLPISPPARAATARLGPAETPLSAPSLPSAGTTLKAPALSPAHGPTQTSLTSALPTPALVRIQPVLAPVVPELAAQQPQRQASPAAANDLVQQASRLDAFIDGFLKQVRDVSLRDGHQSLDGNRWTIEERVPIARLIDQLGLHSVESGGGADFDVATLIGENPFENQRRFNAAYARTEQQWLFRGRNALGLGPQPADVIAATVEHAVKNGLRRVRVFDGMNDVENTRTTVETVNAIRARRGGDSLPFVEGAIAYTVDPREVPAPDRVWTIQTFIEMAKAMRDMGVQGIAIKDMAGVLTQGAVEALIRSIHQEVGLPISVHSHSSTGRATGVLLHALKTASEIGARVVIDVAIGDLSGGTSHPDLRELLTRELDHAGFKPAEYQDHPKLRLLAEIETKIAETAAKYKPSRIPLDPELERLLDESGIPGGMVGTTAKMLRPNLDMFRKKLGRPNLTVEEILKEGLRRVPQVRRDAGSPPLVTPMSQFVLMQAIVNYLSGDYVQVTLQFAAMVKGRFGRVRGTPSPELMAKVQKGGDKPASLAEDLAALIEKAKKLAFEHLLDIPDPIEAALLLTAKNGLAVLTHDQAKFEPRVDGTPAPYTGPKAWNKIVGVRPDGFPIVQSLEGIKTRGQIEQTLGDLPARIAADLNAGINSGPKYQEAMDRLVALGLDGVSLNAGRLILDELIAEEKKL